MRVTLRRCTHLLSGLIVPEPSLTLAKKGLPGAGWSVDRAKSAFDVYLQLAREIQRKACLHVSMAFWSYPSAHI